MTREEAIKILRSEICEPYIGDNSIELVHVATRIGIEALEQQDVLDKIKTEIKRMYRVVLKDTPKEDWSVTWNNCIDEVLEIIDKYKE